MKRFKEYLKENGKAYYETVVKRALYPSACPECGNVDNLTESETKKIVHCQRCYRHYKYEEASE